MAYDDIIRSGVAIINSQTLSLQVAVGFAAWTGQDAYGAPTYATQVPVMALVEQSINQNRMNSTGQTIMTRAKLTFLVPFAPNGAAGRTEPIDNRDKIILPDGTTGPIVSVNTFIDPNTNRGYLMEVWLGM